MQLNQAGSCTERRGESNGIGCVAHRRVVHCCFFMFVKKLRQFVLAPDAFSIAEKGHMHIIKVSLKHITALPTHQSKKSCMNFDQAIVFLVLAQYIRCKSSLFRLHEYGQPIVNFKLTFQHESMLAYKQESHDNKIQTISHHSSPKSSNKSTTPFFN